jgi:adenine/guanine phosphoribosyltransferase-like PRPP-binding protein
MLRMSALIQPPRTPWGDFPDVLIHSDESTVKKHPCYVAAKSGDGNSAIELVLATMSPLQNVRLAQLLQGHTPTLVSAHAYEREGVNAIPEIFADELGKELGWPVDTAVLQTNVVAHTGADGFSRLARQAEFAGAIESGREYVLVDDFVGMGGTLANMKGYIESQGGRVLAAVCLTGKPHSAKLALSEERLLELRLKHGTELENWWVGRFAHAFDALTESEARYLSRTETADTIRNRIAAVQ